MNVVRALACVGEARPVEAACAAARVGGTHAGEAARWRGGCRGLRLGFQR